jgi:hypothetical protein
MNAIPTNIESRDPWAPGVRASEVPIIKPVSSEIVFPEEPAPTAPQIASTFITDLFGDATENPVHICALANDKGDEKFPFRKIETRNPDKIESFLKSKDEPGRAVYFCVTTLIEGATARDKKNVSELSFLWADVDFKYITDTRADVERKLANLVGPNGQPFPPSFTVFTGHGIHAYWALTESIDAQAPGMMEQIEADLRQLADLVAGDLQVCEVARLMRLPGSHNSKFEGEWIPVEVLTSNGKRYDVEELRELLVETSPKILRKSRAPAVTAGQAIEKDPYLEYFKENGLKPPIDVQARLDAMMFMGGGDAAVHKTQTDVASSMVSKGHTDEEIVQALMAATKAAAGDYGKRWNWNREEREIRKDIAGWRVKLAKKGETPTPLSQAKAAASVVADKYIAPVDKDAAKARTAAAIKPKPEVSPNDPNHVKLGMAVLAVIRDRGDDVMFTDKGDFWYSGGLWQMGSGGMNAWLNVEIETAARALDYTSNIKLINETRQWIQRQKDTNRKGTIPWDKHGMVPTVSGLVNPRTGEVRPMLPNDYCTWRIEVEYDPKVEEKCPWWLQMLEDVFADRTEEERAATISVIQELLGAGLVDRKPRELSRALVFLGGSNFGKSGLLEVLGGLFGQEVNSTPIEALEGAHGMMSFVHRRPWILHEAFDQRKWHFSSSVKTIVTGEPINVNIKNGPMLSIRVRAPIFWGTNHPPQFKESTKAVTNRLVVIECRREFFEDKPVGAALEARERGMDKPSTLVLETEMKGLLAWALVGLKRALERGRLALTKQMSDSIEEIRRDSNLVDGFLTDCCFYSRDHRISVPDFCLAFAAWWLANKGENRSVPSNEVIGKAIRAMNDPNIAIGGELRDNRRRYLAGVCLNDEGMAFHEAGFRNRDLEGKTASATSPGVFVNEPMSKEWCLKPSIAAMRERQAQAPKREGSDTFLASNARPTTALVGHLLAQREGSDANDMPKF